MNLELLREMFGIKIYLEFEMFKKDMLQKKAEDIFNRAYEIDCYVNMYEYLIMISEKLDAEQIKSVVYFPNLLASLYDEWINNPEISMEEMESFLCDEIQKQRTRYLKEAA